MLDRGGQHAPPDLVVACPVQALDGEVVRLGPAAGEDDLARPGAEHLGQLLPGFLHHPPGAAARGVQGGRIPEVAEFEAIAAIASGRIGVVAA